MGFLPVAPVLASIIEGISTFQIILFVVGLLLLIVEMFLPGFGIAGGSGVVLLVIAIVLTTKKRNSSGGHGSDSSGLDRACSFRHPPVS